MHGRTALAALLVSAALSACGQEASVAPAKIEVTDGPPPAAAPAEAPAQAPRAGKVQRGTLQTEPRVAVSPTAPVASAPRRPVATPARRPDARRFRASQLQALRVYCATRPPADPRCVDGRVDERVAFAAFEEAR